MYPWGNEAPDETKLNYDENVYDTTAVGSYPDGASPYRAMNMAGNVYEWVADLYDADYYSKAPERNPQGPDSGVGGVVRGGAWGAYEGYARCASRIDWILGGQSEFVGFRCAASPNSL
jgi:formylglycine-generating enzyme required for sulfatase activity